MGQFLRVSPPQPLPEFLAERPFEPLGMKDTGFEVPVTKRDRFTSYYRRDPAGVVLELAYAPDGQWSHLPAFPAGSGGLAATVDDWHRFARMLLVGGTVDARRVLSSESVQQMTTNHLTPSQREIGALFLEGQSWGFGGSVRSSSRGTCRGATAGSGHRDLGTRRAVPGDGRDPAHPGHRGQSRPDRADARLLATR
jgi:CubicO group peptidase (beta-lactamase class C family)